MGHYTNGVWVDDDSSDISPTDLSAIIAAIVASANAQILASNIAVIKNKSSGYIVLAGDDVIRCNGSFTVTLPPATGSGVAYCIKNVGVGVVVVDGNGAETMDGQLTVTLNQYELVTVLDAAPGIWDIL